MVLSVLIVADILWNYSCWVVKVAHFRCRWIQSMIDRWWWKGHCRCLGIILILILILVQSDTASCSHSGWHGNRRAWPALWGFLASIHPDLIHLVLWYRLSHLAPLALTGLQLRSAFLGYNLRTKFALCATYQLPWILIFLGGLNWVDQFDWFEMRQGLGFVHIIVSCLLMRLNYDSFRWACWSLFQD